MIPTANQVTHKIKNQAFRTLKTTPNKIASNGRINKSNAVSICLTVAERFNSIFNHFLVNDLLPLSKTCYLSLSLMK